MTENDQKIADAVADGRMSAEDAEVVQEFGEFLSKIKPPSDRSPEAIRARRRALIEHADLCGLTEDDVARLRAAEEADHPEASLRTAIERLACAGCGATSAELWQALGQPIPRHGGGQMGAINPRPVRQDAEAGQRARASYVVARHETYLRTCPECRNHSHRNCTRSVPNPTDEGPDMVPCACANREDDGGPISDGRGGWMPHP